MNGSLPSAHFQTFTEVCTERKPNIRFFVGTVALAFTDYVPNL